MTGQKIVNRTLKGLPAKAGHIKEMMFLNGIAKLIPGDARIKELFSDDFLMWAKETLTHSRCPESNPGHDGNLDIMALWNMVNRERNTAIHERTQLQKDLEFIEGDLDHANAVIKDNEEQIVLLKYHLDEALNQTKVAHRRIETFKAMIDALVTKEFPPLAEAAVMLVETWRKK